MPATASVRRVGDVCIVGLNGKITLGENTGYLRDEIRSLLSQGTKKIGGGLRGQGYSWVPFLFADAGYIFGGWLSSHLISTGWTVSRSRKRAMLVAAALFPAAIAAPWLPSAGSAIAAICVVLLGHAIWIANLLTLPADLFPAYQIGTVSGLSGLGGAMAGTIGNLVTRYIVRRFSYAPVFVIAGLMRPFAVFLLYRLIPGNTSRTQILR